MSNFEKNTVKALTTQCQLNEALTAENHIQQLPFGQRLSTRLAVLILSILLTVIFCLGVGYIFMSHKAQMDALKQRLLAIVTTLSQTIDAAPIATYIEQSAIHAGNDFVYKAHQGELKKLFNYVAGMDQDISTIYILLPSTQPGILEFYLDYATNGEVGAVGESYDATELPYLLQGFTSPSIEPEPYKDVYGWSISAYAPLKLPDGQVIGIVGADVELPQLTAIRQHVLRMGLLLVGLSILVAILLAWAVARILRKPLKATMCAVQRVSQQDLQTPLSLNRKDEFGLLADCFNQMLADLQQHQFLRETFGRYMSPKIARALLQKGDALDLGGKQCHVTILFSDLRNYTRISERLSPSLLVKMLNLYFGEMNDIIDQHDGCVIEFLGDAVLAVFGAPYDHENHAQQAFDAAIAMQRKLASLNTQWENSEMSQLWQASGVPQLEMRVGLHSGMVVAGNMGSLSRMKYAVIGDTVNVAARLESLNNTLKTAILLSESVKVLLAPETQLLLRSCGDHSVKGRDRAISVYTLDTETIFADEQKKSHLQDPQALTD